MAGLVGQTGFFPGDRRLRELDLLGDGLSLLNRLIPWERFRPILESIPKAKAKGPGGRKPYDRILPFKAGASAFIDRIVHHQPARPVPTTLHVPDLLLLHHIRLRFPHEVPNGFFRPRLLPRLFLLLILFRFHVAIRVSTLQGVAP